MKHILITTIAAVVLVGCGPSTPDISIHIFASAGEPYAIKQHLISGTDPNALDKSGFTPLHYAAREGHARIVEMLIAAGANVNANVGMPEGGSETNAEGGSEGWTPLHEASSYGRYDATKLLIVNGANINQKMYNGGTALDLVAETTGIADLLRKHGGKTGEELKGGEPVAEAPDISIHEAAINGNIEAVKQHLAAGSDVNAKQDDFGQDRILGRTPLFESLHPLKYS